MKAARKIIAQVMVVLAVGGGFTVLGGQLAFADAGSHASCIGIESSAIAPPGSTDEFPGGRSEVNSFLRSLGLKVGSVVSGVAKLHEGSHEACDEATE